MNRDEILAWLRETDEAKLGTLWARADETRRRAVGDEVHLRGLIEVSNHCVRSCAYCGIAACAPKVQRYTAWTGRRSWHARTVPRPSASARWSCRRARIRASAGRGWPA